MIPDRSDIRPRADSDPHSKKHQDDRLDHGVEETFPASDPVAAGCPTGDDKEFGSRVDRKTAQIDSDLVEELARDVRRMTERP